MKTLHPASTTKKVLAKTAIGLAFGVVVVLLLMWLAGAFHRKISVRDVTASVETTGARQVGDTPLAPVRRIRVPRTESAVGSIEAKHKIAVASKIPAKVVTVHVTAGEHVRKGEVLVRLDDTDLAARLEQARAAAKAATAKRDQAKIECDRIKRLLEQDAAAEIEWDRVRTALQASQADLEGAEQAVTEAETIVSYATITSPIDGVVIDKQVEPGDTVMPGRVLVNLYDPKRMQLVARVRESLTRRLSVGQTIGVRIESLGKTCQGRVSEIVPEAESASRTFVCHPIRPYSMTAACHPACVVRMTHQAPPVPRHVQGGGVAAASCRRSGVAV